MTEGEARLAQKLWKQVRFPAAARADRDFVKGVAFLAETLAPVPDDYGRRLQKLRWKYRRQLDGPLGRGPRRRFGKVRGR